MATCEPALTSPQESGTAIARQDRKTLATRFLAHISRETSSGRFIPEMDGLRFAAIAMVVLFHLNGYLMAKSASYVASSAKSDWMGQVAQVGFHGVELFFVISGFILGLPFAAHYLKGAAPVRLRKYYLRRLTRLEPPYLVTLLGLFILNLLVQRKVAASFYPHLAASFFYLHSLIYGTFSPALGVAWTLEIEVQFYVLVPLLTLIFTVRNRALRRFSLLGAILLILLVQPVFVAHNPRASLSVLAYLQFFLVGFLLADVFLVDWKEAPRQHLAWDFVAFAGWPLLFLILLSPVLAHWLFPVCVLFLYCAAFRGTVTRQIFSNRWMTAIGGMCYSIYLIHYEVVSAVGRFTKGIAAGIPYWMYLLSQFLLVGTAVVLICGLYFVLLEKPCMRRDWPQRARDFGKRKILGKLSSVRTNPAG